MSGAELARLAADLVRIDSVNPGLVPGGAGEGELARFVAGWLERAGLEVTLEDAAPGRPNVVGVARGTGGGRSLLLNAHLDTVGVAGMDSPFDPVVREGRLHGRGAYDMKGSLAAIMLAGAEAARLPLRGDVIVTAVVDEELGSIGAEALVRSWAADAAIVAEPTEERVCVAHKGFVAFTVSTRGRAAHGSRPDLGIDAIARMGRVLVGVEALDGMLACGPAHALLGTGSVHAALIEGGQEYSSYPARCVLRGERRTVPGEGPDLVRAELIGLLGGVDGEVRVDFWRPPLETDPGEAVVRSTLRHAGATDVAGAAFWADSALLAAAGTPTVLFGPKGAGAHAEEEWVDLASLERCLGVYLAVAGELCA